jgi:hypothetical protein
MTMEVARWRLVLTGVVLIALGLVGMGLVQARPAAQPVAAPAVDRDEGVDEGVFDHPGHRRGDRGDRAKAPGWSKGLWGGGRHLDRLVHAEAVVDLPEKGLVTFSVDVGTVQSVAEGSITIQPRQGGAVQLATSDETRVRKDRERVGTEALAAGDRVVVISSDETGSVVAKRILVRPAD